MSVTLRGRAQTAPQTTRARAWARSLARWSYLPLACILMLQAGVAVLTLRNTAFQDEALYLYAGRQMMTSIRTGMPLIDPFPSYLSGNPYFYPLLAGIFDAWGGVEAARVLSLVAMLVVTICVYWVAGHLFNRESAIFAAAIFAFQGPVLFLARLATYDAACLMLLALAVVVAFRASTARAPLLALALGPLLALATLNKYAAMLWAPSTLAILAWQTLGARGWFQAVLRVVLALISIAASAALALAVLDRSFLHAVAGSTTSRAITQPAPRPGLIWEVVALGGIGLTLGFLGMLFAGRKRRMIALILFGSALLAPAYHIYKAEPVSLDKHIAYGLFFAAPLAGYAVTRLAGAGHTLVVASRSWLAALALCLIVFLLGAQQGHWMFHTWSDSAGMTEVMRSLVRPAGGRYLAEDMEVARYYLQDVTADWQWVGPFWFEYTNKQGQYFAGVDAYKAAVADGFFDVIELSYGVAAPLDYALQPELLNGKQYDLAAKVFYQNAYGAGYYMIWRKHVVAGAAPSGGEGGGQGGGPPPAPAGPNGFVPFTPPRISAPQGSPLATSNAWKNAAPWSVG